MVEPLKPIGRIAKPAYWPAHLPYEGRKAHWGEMGMKNHFLEKGLTPKVLPILKEFDTRYTDPPVESNYTYSGRDSTDVRDNAKYDTAMPLEEWQQNFHDNASVVKNIRAKWDISPQHPGFNLWADYNGPIYTDKSRIGTMYLPGVLNLSTRGPRFFDSPINEKCWEKSLACGKYAAFASITYVGFISFAGVFDNPYWKQFRYHFKRIVPLSVVSSLLWGATVCTAADVRQKDDEWNTTIAAAVFGLVVASKSGVKMEFAKGSQAFALAAALGWWWMRCRKDEMGLGGFNTPQIFMYAPQFHTKHDMFAKKWGNKPDYGVWRVEDNSV